jgi:hypothetical protein
MAVDPRLIRQAVEASLEGQTKLTETGDRAPDELGTVTGWRAWKVDRRPDENGQLLLHSATFDYAWVPYEKARASCDRCKSLDPRSSACVPGEHCTCGFYTARSLSHLRQMGYHRYNASEDGQATIVGRVANWGKVIPGTQGWRAEYAYPEMLYVPFEIAAYVARAVSDTYGVPVTLLNLLDPNAKPGRKRGLGRVLPPRRQEPKFLVDYRKAHHMEGDWWDDEEEE